MSESEVTQTYLQCAVEEAAVLARLVAQAFAGGNGVHGARTRNALQPTAARRKVVPLPRHGCRPTPFSSHHKGCFLLQPITQEEEGILGECM